jgi:hypothetical protein
MANTSVTQFLDTLNGVLSFAGGTGSVNLYMAHGGTNFGFTAGAQRLPTAKTLLQDDAWAAQIGMCCRREH